MAGFRQGLALAASAGPQRSGGRRTGAFLSREETSAAQSGKKVSVRRCSKGARGAAVPCQPKPLTRTWMSAGLTARPRRFGEDRAGVQCPMQRLLPQWCAVLARAGCAPCRCRESTKTPRHTGAALEAASRTARQRPQRTPRPLRSPRHSRRADLREPVRWWGWLTHHRARCRPAERQPPVSKPRPVLPDGALRCLRRRGRAAGKPPAPFTPQAARPRPPPPAPPALPRRPLRRGRGRAAPRFPPAKPNG